MTYIKIFFFIVGIAVTSASQAQELLKVLGKPYNSKELTEMRNRYHTTNPKELLIPAQQVMRIVYPDDGIETEYTSDMSLYKIGLYDSGYTYQRYDGKLPFSVEWGMSYQAIETSLGMLDFVKENEFIRRFSDSMHSIDFYFTDNRLSHLRIIATTKTILKNASEIYAATGLRLLPNGKAVEGNVNDGKGTMMWGNNAAIYKGDWLYGLPHGRGQFKDSSGNKYDGEFKLGFFWGQGNFYSESEKYSYSGEFVMSKKHGDGRIGYSSGIVYEGEWVQGIMHGNGTYAMGKDYLYEGDFEDGKLNGKGKLTTQQGYIDGFFKDGKPHGKCMQATNDGTYTIEGTFVNGRKEGAFNIVYMGETRMAIYQNDIEVKAGPVDPSLLPKQ